MAGLDKIKVRFVKQLRLSLLTFRRSTNTTKQPIVLYDRLPNSAHCKTCDIKDPAQTITGVPPEGGGGPN